MATAQQALTGCKNLDSKPHWRYKKTFQAAGEVFALVKINRPKKASRRTSGNQL